MQLAQGHTATEWQVRMRTQIFAHLGMFLLGEKKFISKKIIVSYENSSHLIKVIRNSSEIKTPKKTEKFTSVTLTNLLFKENPHIADYAG